MGSSSVATDNGHRNSQSQLRAVLGSGPLTKIPDVGWYYRLKIISANTNWCGGFGLGITLSKTANMPTLPDRASRVQYSWHAGLPAGDHGRLVDPFLIASRFIDRPPALLYTVI